MIWKRKVFVGVLWLSLGAAACGVIYKLPSIYRAETLILVDSQKIPERYVSSTVSSDLQDRLATISQQILSGTNLKKIINDLNLYSKERKTHVEEELLEMMRKDIEIKLERGWTGNRPGAFRIAFQGENPAVVAQVANRLADLYIDENLRTREVQAAGTADFINNQLQDAKKSLDEMEAQVSQYKLQHNGELPEQQATLSGALTRLQLQLQTNHDGLNQAQQQRIMLENSINLQESAIAALQRAAEVGSVAIVDGRPVLGRVPAPPKRSEVIEAQIAERKSKGYGDSYPEVKRLQLELAEAKAAESKAAPEVSVPPVPAPPVAITSKESKAGAKSIDPKDALEINRQRERATSLKVQLQLAQQEIERLNKEQQQINNQINQYQAKLERLPVREQELSKVTRDYEIQKENYKSLLERKISAEMATDLEHRQQAERFTKLDPAQIPEIPTKPNRPLLYTAAVLGSLLVGMALGFGRELKEDLLLGEWELPKDILVLARIPHIRITLPETTRGGSADDVTVAWRPEMQPRSDG
jgi:polysaccharide chain length determinant protein (PEP-CTERM system associated)